MLLLQTRYWLPNILLSWRIWKFHFSGFLLLNEVWDRFPGILFLTFAAGKLLIFIHILVFSYETYLQKNILCALIAFFFPKNMNNEIGLVNILPVSVLLAKQSWIYAVIRDGLRENLILDVKRLILSWIGRYKTFVTFDWGCLKWAPNLKYNANLLLG